MKKQITKGIAILLFMMQFLALITIGKTEQATIQNTITLQTDHECDSLVEYWMEDYQKWSYKRIWHVYYENEDGNTYPAFCIQPEKQGVGTGYDSYQADIQKENDPVIWRILYKGYMGKHYTDYDLECDDDFYSATKIALHSYAEGSVPTEKYILGTRPVSGNTAEGQTVEDIQRRAQKVLTVAQELYEYGIQGEGQYEAPSIQILPAEKEEIQMIEGKEYWVKSFTLQANRDIQNYQIRLEGCTQGTILQSEGKTIHLQIPTTEIKEDIQGTIYLEKIEIQTLPIYLCKSHVEGAQNYVTYTSGIEEAQAQINVQVEANTATLEIQKVDMQTQEPVPNVSFEITDENGESIGIFETDETGKVVVENIAPQPVWVEEIKAPEGYEVGTEKQYVELEWGKTSSITIENHKTGTPVIPLPKTGY